MTESDKHEEPKRRRKSTSPKREKGLNGWERLMRLLFGITSMLLLLISLNALIYTAVVAANSPECSKCKPKVDNKKCNLYCNTYVDDFTLGGLKHRVRFLIYFCVLLMVRCIALISGFIGVFHFSVYLMIAYVILYSGLFLALLVSIGFVVNQNKSVDEFLFGNTTASHISWPIIYALELILFFIGLYLTYKYIRIKRSKEQHSNPNPN